ncbi:hypothetical protein [Shewanella algae]|uniref:hypothetical protein n=1 Tax=Shewanella algae TaxID=38313 RepID=UPI0031F5191D
MIITQQIINGVCSVTKTGSYFNLISAGGVVRVKLTKNGSTVLDSKMWVGMNLDKAQPFDEVEIYGADGPIEFWAGDVSMNQARATLTGASAIRTSQQLLIGSAPLTGADVTRQSVRIRTDKEIWIGGAGVNGAGWRIAAGATEEIPVAGVLYGYRIPPELDMSQSAFVSNADGLISDGALTSGDVTLVSEDKSFIIFSKSSSRTVKQWEAGTGWVNHPYFYALAAWSQTSMVKSLNEKAVFVFRHKRVSDTVGTLRIDISRDEGRNFTPFVDIPWSAMVPAGEATNVYTSSYVSAIGNMITWNQTGIAVAVNVKSRAVTLVTSGAQGWGDSAIRRLAMLSEDGLSMLAIRKNASGATDRLLKTTDGGNTWYEPQGIPAGIEAKEFNTDYSGQHVSLCCSDGLVRLSNDGGESFVTSQTPTGITSEPPLYLASGIWIGFSGTLCYSYAISGTEITYSASPAGGNASYDEAPFQILGDGTMYRREGGNMNPQGCDVWQLKVTGDLSPAVVEVMELIA